MRERDPKEGDGADQRALVGRDTATRVSAGRWDRRVGATTRWRGEVFAGPGERFRAAGASWAAGTCWAERDEGRAGPAEEKKEQAELGRGERVGRTGLGCWVGFGFPAGFLFSFSFLFLIQTKFEFKYKFEFKPHSNN